MILAMTDTLRDFGTAAAIVLGSAGFLIASAAFVRISNMSPRVDLMEDKLTPSFAEEHRRSDARQAVREFADADTDPKIPVVVDRPSPVPRDPERTDTEENDMPRQLEQAKLEAERDPVESEWREFKRADGTTARFRVRQP